MAAIYFCVCGGPYGLEEVVKSGPGMAIFLILLMPLVWAIPAALMTAELTSAIPAEGGYYVWVRRAMGPFWGFLCGWWTWVYTWVDVAIYPVMFATYVQTLLRLFGYGAAFDDRPWLRWGVGMAIIVPLTWLNIRGVKVVGKTAVGFFALLLIPFVILVALGLPAFLSHPETAITPRYVGKSAYEAFTAGLFLVMWNYLGWDSMSTIAGEVEDPKKAFPRALALGVPLVTLTYLIPVLVGLAFLRDPAAWTEGAWTEVARRIGGSPLAIAVAFGGIISAAGLFSSTLLAGSRVPFVIAEDNVLPRALTRVHSRYGTPWVAILVSAVFYSVFSFGKLSDLAEVDVVIYSAGLFLETIALLVLRYREPELPRPYRIPGGWPGVIVLALAPKVILVAAIVAQVQGEDGRKTLLVTAVALLSGPVVWYSRKLTHMKIARASEP
ncbi:amino acid transporter [Fimbriimonas ginsengisoli Gsoil 348]|uniref:Amino acid transporter n=1 Tax=Fimbriimonas ginsengisoli Gsoil 348 TaxID=661478 RepID=A0A068NQR6_FIMGI|nr:amino acid transporter [Fimbriimonas ginsengisoli Gsoil 348]